MEANIILNEHNIVKRSNWQEVDKQAIYKLVYGWGVELGTAVYKEPAYSEFKELCVRK